MKNKLIIILLFVLLILPLATNADECLPEIGKPSSLNVWGDNLSRCFNGTMLRASNMTNIREGHYNLANFTLHFTDRLAEQFNYGNLTLILGDNASLIRVGNLSGIKVGNATWSNNASGVHCGGINGAASNLCTITSSGGGFVNESDIKVNKLNVTSINGTDIILFNKSISLDGYLTGATVGAFLTNLSPNVVFNRLNISFLNDTNIALFNKSISLDGYLTGATVGSFLTNLSPNVVFNRLNVSFINDTNIALFNKSISLDGYITAAANGAFLTNLSPNVVFNRLNLSFLNDTNIALFNRSISLDLYNQSVSLTGYYPTSVALSNFQIANATAVLLNSSIVRTDMLRNALSNQTDIQARNLNMTNNITLSTNRSIFLNGTNKVPFGMINDTCYGFAPFEVHCIGQYHEWT